MVSRDREGCQVPRSVHRLRGREKSSDAVAMRKMSGQGGAGGRMLEAAGDSVVVCESGASAAEVEVVPWTDSEALGCYVGEVEVYQSTLNVRYMYVHTSNAR